MNKRIQPAWPRHTLLSLFLLTLLLSGCGGWNERPFVAMGELSARMAVVDEVLEEQRKAAKEEDMERIAENKRLIRGLELDFPGEDEPGGSAYGYHFKEMGGEDEPLFLKMERFRLGLQELNQGLTGYINGLAQLASGEMIDTSAFAGLSASVNSGLYTFAGLSGNQEITPPRVDLFSAMAGKLAEGYVLKERRDHLQEVLEENRGAVDGVVTHIRQGVAYVADQVRADYSLKRRELRNAMADPEYDSVAVANLMYRFSAKTGLTLDLLREVDAAYALLAEKHAKLPNYLRGGEFSTAALEASVARLEQIYAKLELARGELE